MLSPRRLSIEVALAFAMSAGSGVRALAGSPFASARSKLDQDEAGAKANAAAHSEDDAKSDEQTD
jgi:hypothetical protein